MEEVGVRLRMQTPAKPRSGSTRSIGYLAATGCLSSVC